MRPNVDLMVIMARGLLRDGVAQALAADDGIVVVGASGDVQNGLERARRHQPDVVLMSVERNGGHAGFDLGLCQSVLAVSRECRVLILAKDATTQLVRHALEDGARGVFDVNLSLEMLSRAIHAVHEGEIWISRSLYGPLLDELRRQHRAGSEPTADAVSSLTRREHDVLSLLARGCDLRAIADELFLSPHTIRTHIRNVMRKLGAHTRLEAVLIATDAGLLDASDLAPSGH